MSDKIDVDLGAIKPHDGSAEMIPPSWASGIDNGASAFLPAPWRIVPNRMRDDGVFIYCGAERQRLHQDGSPCMDIDGNIYMDHGSPVFDHQIDRRVAERIVAAVNGFDAMLAARRREGGGA